MQAMLSPVAIPFQAINRLRNGERDFAISLVGSVQRSPLAALLARPQPRATQYAHTETVQFLSPSRPEPISSQS